MASLISPVFSGPPSSISSEKHQKFNQIIEVTSLEDVEKYLDKENLDSNKCIVACNLFNTLITYDDPHLRTGVNKFIDGLVREKIKSMKVVEDEKKFFKINKEKYMSTILLSTQNKLTEGSIPDVINRLSKKFILIGLTENKTGPFGEIPNAEDWRIDTLKKLNITFSPNLKVDSQVKFSDDSIKQNYAIYKNGILFVGDKKNKTQTLLEFISKAKPSIDQVVVIDNKKENIEDLQNELKDQKISVLGFYYNYPIDNTYTKEIVEKQEKILLESNKWVNYKDLEK